MLLVVGPSGSGKSTLARAVAGLLSADVPGSWQGSLRVGDVDVAQGELTTTAAAIGAGIVLQDPASQLVMERVGDDVAFGLENLGWPLDAMREGVPEVLGQVGLAGFEERRSTRLSGGEQQRVALAGVLALGPGLLVLDEPTAHLDPEGSLAVFAILQALRRARSTTIVLIEHRAELAWPLAEVVLALGDDGRPIDLGPPDVVLERSRTALDTAGIWLPAGADREGARAPSSVPSGGSPALDASLPVLTFDDVRFAYDRAHTVLREIDLAVSPGDRVALTGPNGSGKTTLLRLAMGLLRPTSGRVRLAGRDPSRVSAVQLARLAGYVVQEPELGFLAQSVREEIELGLAAEQLPYAHELAERLRLPLADFGDRSPYRLSGGEQRRLSLVTGLARRPLLLALDEPTFGQDRRGHEALVAALANLVGEGSAILAATHDDRFIRDAVDQRVDLADGWIVSESAVSDAPTETEAKAAPA